MNVTLPSSAAAVPTAASGVARNASGAMAATPHASFADAFASLSDVMHGVSPSDNAVEDDMASESGRSDAEIEADAAVAAEALFGDIAQPGPVPGWAAVAFETGAAAPVDGREAETEAPPSGSEPEESLSVPTTVPVVAWPSVATVDSPPATIAAPQTTVAISAVAARFAPSELPVAEGRTTNDSNAVSNPDAARLTTAVTVVPERNGHPRVVAEAATGAATAAQPQEHRQSSVSEAVPFVETPHTPAAPAGTQVPMARSQIHHTVERLRAGAAAAERERHSRAAGATSRLPEPASAGVGNTAMNASGIAQPTSAPPAPPPVAVVAPALETAVRDHSQGGASAHGSGVEHHASLLRPTLSLATPATAAPFSTMVGSTGTDVLPAETGHQIVQSLRVLFARDGGEAHIKLDPRQFGDVTIRVKVDQGQVVARIEAEAPVVREWLQSNQNLLRQGLAGQHLALDRLDVTESSSSAEARAEDERSNPDQQRERQHQQQRRRRADTSAIFDIVA